MKRSKKIFLVSNFKKLFFVRFWSKFPWCSPDPLKFESYYLQYYKKNCRKLVFSVISEKLLQHIIFDGYFTLCKELAQIQEEKNSGFLTVLRRTLRSETILVNWKFFKNGVKCILFHLKTPFRSQNI